MIEYWYNMWQEIVKKLLFIKSSSCVKKVTDEKLKWAYSNIFFFLFLSSQPLFIEWETYHLRNYIFYSFRSKFGSKTDAPKSNNLRKTSPRLPVKLTLLDEKRKIYWKSSCTSWFNIMQKPFSLLRRCMTLKSCKFDVLKFFGS